MKTVTAFLLTEIFQDAARHSGNSQPADFRPDSDGRISRAFSGDYTVDEIRALLADLERVQAAYDAWQTRKPLPLRSPRYVIVDHAPYIRSHGKYPHGRGSWFFSAHRSIDFNTHTRDLDYFEINATYSEAKAAAKSWAAGCGHTAITVQP
jgi:hypothetical protein